MYVSSSIVSQRQSIAILFIAMYVGQQKTNSHECNSKCIDGDHLAVNLPTKVLVLAVLMVALKSVFGDAFSSELVPVFPHNWKIVASKSAQWTPNLSLSFRLFFSLTATGFSERRPSERVIARTSARSRSTQTHLHKTQCQLTHD